MPFTKGDLQQLKEAMEIDKLQKTIEEVKDSVANNAVNISKKLDEKFEEFEHRLVLLESNINTDILELKADLETVKTSNTNLTLLVHNNKIEVENEFEHIKKANDDFATRESQYNLRLAEADSTIESLNAKVVQLEKVVHAGLQHNRKWNVEIDGMPTNVGDDPKQLETAFIEVMSGININCAPIDIEAIHRLPTRSGIKPTIVRLNNRRLVDVIHKNKHKLKNLQSLDININGLTEDSKIFIKPSLSPYFKNLAFNCRLLKKDSLIQNVITEDDGSLKIKTLNNEFIKIKHSSDLTERFKDFTKFKFD